MSAEQPSAIIGVTTTCKTRVDGSLVFSVEVEPRHMQAAFALFGAPGTPVAVARIMPEVAQSQARQETADPVKGGVLAKLAGMWCGDSQFLSWLRSSKFADSGLHFYVGSDAAAIIRETCQIESRAELDHNEAAAALFHSEFRLPYNAWLQGRG